MALSWSRCDLIVTPSPEHRLILELVASSTIHDIEEHFRLSFFVTSCPLLQSSHALDNVNVIGASHCWVIHFTLKEESKEFVYPYPPADSGVRVMHVHHDLLFSTVTFKYLDTDGMKKEDVVSL